MSLNKPLISAWLICGLPLYSPWANPILHFFDWGVGRGGFLGIP